jgi:hypothetical protein
MILWTLPTISSDVVCSIEKQQTEYRVVVRHGSTTLVDDVLADVRRARRKADIIRRELLEIGCITTA